MVVPDFVGVQTLQPDRMGVALGDIFLASIFNRCKVPLRQAGLSRNFRLNLDGNKLTLVARRVDLESATFLAVASKEVSWSCESPAFGENRLVFKIR